jgi:uncharacterized membrane protein
MSGALTRTREDQAVITTLARLGLGIFLFIAGAGHFISTAEFTAQVPPWMPAPEFVVYASGVVEIALGIALIVTRRRLPIVGWIVAAFFVIIFPGNVWQYIEGRDAFGLDSDAARVVRLFFQPLLVVWALWCTGAWRAGVAWWRDRRASQAPSNS